MSERMIELQRARMLSQSQRGGTLPSHSPVALASSGRQIPQQTAVSAMRNEDLRLQRFLHKMKRRDDSGSSINDPTCGPTVPSALSRRMLHKQGVGYLDNAVAAVVSASADRFLATVLHQAAACRDQRLKGVEMAKEDRRVRKRHLEQRRADTEEKHHLRQKKLEEREAKNLEAIAAANKKGGSSSTPTKESESNPKKKKKKTTPGAAAKEEETTQPNNGTTNPEETKETDHDDDEESFDSIDDEEDYYQDYYGNEVEDEDSADEDDETLRLIDFTRPLEAWDFHLTGKPGLDSTLIQNDDKKGYDDKDDVIDETGDAADAGLPNAIGFAEEKPASDVDALTSPKKGVRFTSPSPAKTNQ